MSIFDIFKRLENERAAKSAEPISWIVAGLGNPGAKYEGTRHNAGFLALDQYCKEKRVRMDRMKFRALLGQTEMAGQRVLLLKPQTYMNLSGEAISEAARFYQIDAAHIIVLVDDVSLAVGTLRVRAKGSAGGQNGLKNIIQHLGTDEFARIKIGVGQKPHPDYDLVDWVLGHFSPEDMQQIGLACRDAMAAAECLISEGAAAAAQKYNGKRRTQEEK